MGVSRCGSLIVVMVVWEKKVKHQKDGPTQRTALYFFVRILLGDLSPSTVDIGGYERLSMRWSHR